ncbi:MAG: 23S rRNA (uracil-5-)-methyltransferase RumA, partial [Firmicutes bacterium HGW-Firmicutes-5]
MNKKDVLEAYISRVEFPNKGIIEIGDYKVTVKNALPGQKVRAVVNKKRKNRIEARLLEVLEKAPTEILGACEVFGLCGGCLYQSLPYDEQLKLKVEQVQNLLKPLGIVDRYEGIISSPEIYEYRNKMEYSFGNAYIDGPLALGLHKRGSMYDIVNATECKIIHDDFNKVVQATLDLFKELDLPFYHKRTHEGYLRYLVVRRGVRSSQLQINLVTSSQLEPNLQVYVDKLRALDLDHEIKGIIHTISDQLSDAVKVDDMKILYGEEHMDESLLGLNFKISPFSFFQTNTLGAEKLYEVVRDYVGETKEKVI